MLLAHVLTRLRPASPKIGSSRCRVPLSSKGTAARPLCVSVVHGGASTCPRIPTAARPCGRVPSGVPWRRGVPCGASVVPFPCPVLNKGKRRNRNGGASRGAWRSRCPKYNNNGVFPWRVVSRVLNRNGGGVVSSTGTTATTAAAK